MPTLTAITVCVNYADYLAHILRNKEHFERWIIVTPPQDTATQRLCREHRLDCLISDTAGPFGEMFDSAYNKAPLINCALDTIADGEWVVLLDADTLLPSSFRQRLDRLRLYPRALYGLMGRVVCNAADAFSAMMQEEPWLLEAQTHQHVLGYFQMFRMCHTTTRYPSIKPLPEMHDDIAFQHQFKPFLRFTLPMTALHIGPPVVNWAGRKSKTAISLPRVAMQQPQSGTPVPAAIERLAAHGASLLCVGYDSTTPFRALASLYKHVAFLDWHGISSAAHQSAFPIMQSDALVRHHMVGAACSDLDNVSFIAPCDTTSLVAVLSSQAGSVVYLNCELSTAVLITWYQLCATARLHSSWVAGRYCSVRLWQHIAACIHELWGNSLLTFGDTSWYTPVLEMPNRIPLHCHKRVGTQNYIEKEPQECIPPDLYIVVAQEREAVFITQESISTFRASAASICVISVAGECPVLQILALQLSIGLLETRTSDMANYGHAPMAMAATAIPPNKRGNVLLLSADVLPHADAISECARQRGNKIVIWGSKAAGLSRREQYLWRKALKPHMEAVASIPVDLLDMCSRISAVYVPQTANLLQTWYRYTQLFVHVNTVDGLALACALLPLPPRDWEIHSIDTRHNAVGTPIRSRRIVIKSGSDVWTFVDASNYEDFLLISQLWDFACGAHIYVQTNITNESLLTHLKSVLMERGSDYRVVEWQPSHCETHNQRSAMQLAAFVAFVEQYGKDREAIVWVPATCAPVPGAQLFTAEMFFGMDFVAEFVQGRGKLQLALTTRPSLMSYAMASTLQNLTKTKRKRALDILTSPDIICGNSGPLRTQLLRFGETGWKSLAPA